MTDAVGWHSEIAQDFDAKYVSSAPFRERFNVWSKLIEKYVTAQSGVLDAGCGSGIFSDLAAKSAHSVLGFDGSAEMVALAEARKINHDLANAEFRVAFLPDPHVLDNRKFDVILCSSVLEYVEDYWKAFDWLSAALKPGGTIIFSMPNGRSLYRKAERLAFRMIGRPAYYAHVRNVPLAEEVCSGLANRGYRIHSLQYYAAAPLVSPLARALALPQYADNLFVIACGRSSSCGRAS